MRSKTIAGSLIAGLLLCTAATALYAETEEDSTPPDFRGIWARAPEPEFLAVPGDKEGKPLVKLPVTGPDAGEIIAGDYDNPILQPWAKEQMKKARNQGMQVFDQAPFGLYEAGMISAEDAARYADSQHEVKPALRLQSTHFQKTSAPDARNMVAIEPVRP